LATKYKEEGLRLVIEARSKSLGVGCTTAGSPKSKSTNGCQTTLTDGTGQEVRDARLGLLEFV
jgi:hypothetical protein